MTSSLTLHKASTTTRAVVFFFIYINMAFGQHPQLLAHCTYTSFGSTARHVQAYKRADCNCVCTGACWMEVGLIPKNRIILNALAYIYILKATPIYPFKWLVIRNRLLDRKGSNLRPN